MNRHTASLLTDHMVFAPKYRGKMLKGRTSRILRKEFPTFGNGVASISGRRAASTGLWGRDGRWRRGIFANRIVMNIIERNNKEFVYRPRNYFVRGIPVTEGDRGNVQPLGCLKPA